MSTNIHFSATREIIVVKTGAITTQTADFFYVWQTPTAVTNQIVAAVDPVQAYKDWVLDNAEDVQEPVYAETDIFCEGEPVGTKVVNDGKVHIKLLDSWIQTMESQGYDIAVEAM